MNFSGLKNTGWLLFVLISAWSFTGCATKGQQQSTPHFGSDSYLIPLLTDYSSLADSVVKNQKLFDRKTELNRARAIYSYVLTEKNCQVEKKNKASLNAIQQMMERQRDAGLARQSDYLLAKVDLLTAEARESQCNTQLNVLRSYAESLDITLQTIEWKYTPPGEALSLKLLKNSFSAQPLLWQSLEWPLMKLIHSINGRSSMDKALSTQLIVHTQLALSLEEQFRIGLVSIKDFLKTRQEAFKVEKKLNENRMAMMMELAELKYLLAKPIQPL